MAASDNLNPVQFDRYGGGYYAKPKNVTDIAVPAEPKYRGLANAATRAAQDTNEKALTRTRRRSA